MQNSADLHDESISSTMESVQEHSDPAHQNVLKKQSNEDDTKAQSGSELDKEALSNNKQSISMEREDDSLKQSKLEGEVPPNNKLSGSLEREDCSLKQSELEDIEAPSDDKLSGSMEREVASLKQNQLEGGALSNNKLSGGSLRPGLRRAKPNFFKSDTDTDEDDGKNGVKIMHWPKLIIMMLLYLNLL